MLKRSEDEELSTFARRLITSMTEEDEELLVQLVKSTLTRIRAQLERLLKVLDEQEKLLTNLTKRKRASQERQSPDKVECSPLNSCFDVVFLLNGDK